MVCLEELSLTWIQKITGEGNNSAVSVVVKQRKIDTATCTTGGAPEHLNIRSQWCRVLVIKVFSGENIRCFECHFAEIESVLHN